MANELQVQYDVDKANLGMPTAWHAVTATLYVSPNGNDTDGSSWTNAHTTIQGALAAASSDANDLTLILVWPHTTYYDINTTGDPTYTGNYDIKGSHRNWAKIKNDHVSATSIMKFTGKVALEDLTFDCGTGTNNWVIIDWSGTKGARVRHTYFECEQVTWAQTALTIWGGTEYIRIEDVMVHGVVANTKGMLLNDVKLSDYLCMQFHDCATAIQFTNADTDENRFNNILIHESTLGLDIDAGNLQMFKDVQFFACTTNVDDEVWDHQYEDIRGEFDIAIEPDNTDGVNVSCDGSADTWGADTEIRAAATSTKPFRIVGSHCEPNANRIFQVRFTADSGSTFFDQLQMSDSRRESVAAPSGTEHIFNAGTRISASVRDEDGWGNVNIWLEIQEI